MILNQDTLHARNTKQTAHTKHAEQSRMSKETGEDICDRNNTMNQNQVIPLGDES